MRLYLFTNFFPLRRSEPFLTNEFSITQRHSEFTVIFPLYGNIKENTLPPASVEVLSPPLISSRSKKTLFRKGLFNTSAAHHHLAEIITKNLFLRPKALYWHIVSAFITRTVISSPSFSVLKNRLSKEKKAVLYFYWGDNMCWLLPYIHKFIDKDKVKVVIRLHRTDLYENLKGDHAPLREKIMALADVIAPVSQHGVTYLKAKYPEFASRIQLCRLGVFDHGLNPVSENYGEYTVVSVSSLVAVKRVNLVFRSLKKTGLKIQWHHFGDGPLLEDLRRESQHGDENLKISLHGFIENSRIIDFYKNNPVHLFINVSESEGLPVSIMEALSFGIPVLATDAGGTGDVVDATVGSLIPVASTAEIIAGEIEKILVPDKKNYDLKRMAARARFQNDLSAEKNYPQFYQLLQSL